MSGSTVTRPGAVTFKGNPLTLVGAEVAVGSAAPDFDLVCYGPNGMEHIRKTDLAGKPAIISVVPSLDTPVCQTQTKVFNERLSALGDKVTALTVSLDLMTAAPGQSLADVEADLTAAIALGPEHVSVYCLTWEPGTAFAAARRRGDLAAVPEELERAMFETAIDRLEAAGYEHYEVSNFARPGHQSRHNLAYWDCRPWEAFGPGAARFDGRTRTTNHRSTTTWMTRVLAGENAAGDIDRMTAEEAARERLVVGLRRRAGVERAAFHAASGLDLDRLAGKQITRWMAAGLADDDGQTVRLTREGLLVSDSLWSEVL